MGSITFNFQDDAMTDEPTTTNGGEPITVEPVPDAPTPDATDSKGVLASKTIWFGVAVAIAGFLEEIVGLLDGTGVPGWVLGAIGVLVTVLRLVTKAPVAVKKKTNGEEGSK